jgi:phosphotriesterase-related protein
MHTGLSGSLTPEAPNLAGKVLTVNGPVAPEQLGISLMHEHLFCDLWKEVVIDNTTPAEDLVLVDQKLSLGNLGLARDGRPIHDNYILDDEALITEEVMEFQKMGGRTIVEVSSIGLGRDPLALQRVANATGLNIVMGTGWYQKAFHPSNMDQLTIEDLTKEIIRDITVGVGDTGIRAGIIGEIGINGDPLTSNEEKSIRATARASRITGAAISFHHGGTGRERFRVADMVAEEGADLKRTIFGHSNSYCGDLEFLLELLHLGIYLQFDTLGTVGTPVARLPAFPGPRQLWSSHQAAEDVLVGEAIPKLVDLGFEDQILISQDVCLKVDLKGYGGTGYTFILDKFIPFLRTQGLTEEHVDKLIIKNPQRVLTFADSRQ